MSTIEFARFSKIDPPRDAGIPEKKHLDELLETEVRLIAQEIHDSAGQVLSAVYLEVHHALEHAPPHLRRHLYRITSLLDHVESDLRRISRQLRPPELEAKGLMPALHTLCRSITCRTGIRATACGRAGVGLPPRVEAAVYRIVQEGVTNAARHSQATHIQVSVLQSGGRVLCEICDDGIGVDHAQYGAGLGLTGIRERAATLGGQVRVLAPPSGRGTMISASIPLSPPTNGVDHAGASPSG